MIVSTDVQTILYKAAHKLGILNVYKDGTEPEGEVKSERIVIIVNSIGTGIYWKSGFAYVNICIPYKDRKGTKNLERLNVVERLACKVMNSTSEFDNTPYTYEVESHGVEEDKDLKCHYVSVRILFRVLNVKE